GIGDLTHLAGGGIGQFAAAMPDIDVPQPSQAIDDLAPVAEVQDRPPALLDQEWRLVLLGVVQRVNQKAPVALEQFGRAVHRVLLRPASSPTLIGSAPLKQRRRSAIDIARPGWAGLLAHF